MGKPTGFLEFDRCTRTAVAPEERIKNFNEFHSPLDEEARCEQGARCMNCGIPFCQSAIKLNNMVSGCPLHNLIPEWNDQIYHKNWSHAYARLSKTSNFPEFTGRVCPALCEAACTCGLNDDPVTVRDNELTIIERAFAEGMVQPQIPALRTDKKIAVIGSGPSGLACADQLNQRGHNVTVFERDDRPGGLLMYGIPNMKLEKDIVKRRTDLMEAEGISFVTGQDGAEKKFVKKVLADFDAVVLCTGAKKPRDLNVSGRDSKGVYFAVDFLKSTTKALLDNGLEEGTYVSAEGKKVIVVGGGDTGNDCVGTCIRHGCKSVVQLEMMPKLPDERAADNQWPQWPRVCKTDYGQEEAISCFGHDPRLYQSTVTEIISDNSGNVTAVKVKNLADNSEQIMDCDLLLIAAGFLGTEDKLFKAYGVSSTERSNIQASEDDYMTDAEKVFAAGDSRRGQSLVVWAIHEGREAARAVDKYLMGYTNMNY